MVTLHPFLLVLAAIAPLFGALFSLLLGTKFLGALVSKRACHSITVLCVALSFILSIHTLLLVLDGATFNGAVYQWMQVGALHLEIGFQIDSLSALMMCIVTFVSLMVHIYTIGYMQDDEGYSRFFGYISLFTFAMLMLVMSNNLLQLFFGWEAVGLVSYLLIGFWYTKPTAIVANLKAFLVNRVGDFGFILGIGLIVAYTGSLDYGEVFQKRDILSLGVLPGTNWMLATVTCICLFIGAMGKSAQFPLHVWLPDSMEGPTPISALIHAATMVTAGIFMVARLSPLFELSDTALSFILVIGAITALLMGLIGMVQNDIKRIVAYSTLSQLGYMTVALGASAYSVAIFHLMTHAFFKALLFLGAGSVIVGMHHDQDIRHMGGLRKYMPITWLTSLIGSLALIGTPFFSGFYSKDSIIEAVQMSQLPGSAFAQFSVLIGVFITAFYSFRMYFKVFHGKEHFAHASSRHSKDHHGLAVGEKPHESSGVMTWPLVLLAIPSVLSGYFVIGELLHGHFFDGVIWVDDRHQAMFQLTEEFHHLGGAWEMAWHGFTTQPFWLALAGVALAYGLCVVKPSAADFFKAALIPFYKILDNKYYLDTVNEYVFARGARFVGSGLWRLGDKNVIDGWVINGSAKCVAWLAKTARLLQTGYLYHYAFIMILGMLGLLLYFMPNLFTQ